MNEIISEEVKEEFSHELIEIGNQVLALKVIDTTTYLQAGEIWKAISAAEKRIKTRLDPLCEKANETHKGLTRWRTEELEKYKPLKEHVNKEQTTYNLEQEHLRKEQEDKLRREAQKAEEERRLHDAIIAEQLGLADEAMDILNEPVFVPPPIVERTTPTIAGQTMTTTWRWRLKDINLVPRQYMTTNDTAINAAARSLKDKCSIAGIEIYPELSMRGVRQ